MILTVIMFVVALCLSAVAAFYSIVGLTAIFAAAVVPIIIMGSILEVAKLVVTVWLHEYWQQAKLTMKLYLVPAVGMLMLITSMGIFGFLSKAHMDQSMVSGDVQSKIAIYDEKIKTARENIEANRKQLKQMDEAVDQIMGRSTDEKGADKANAVRKSQQRDRIALAKDIETNQKQIATLNDEAAPIRAEVRKVEAEVGPIKYIAALIYGDDSDANMLERAVRWVIIILVIVFDPLAIIMLLASTESRKWYLASKKKPEYEPDDGALSEEQIDQIKKSAQDDLPTGNVVTKSELFPIDVTSEEEEAFKALEPKEELIADKHPYLNQPFVSFNTSPMVHKPEIEMPETVVIPEEVIHTYDDERLVSNHDKKILAEDDEDDRDSLEIKAAKKRWKDLNPNETLKNQRQLFERGAIKELPWMKYIEPRISFGRILPDAASKGDQFVLTDSQPTRLFKYNGTIWIEIDKATTDQYTYNQSYIDYLIAAISAGEYDADLLTESEQFQIKQQLGKDN